MAMQVNALLSKHGILIGAAAIAIFVVTSCEKVMTLKSIGATEEKSDDHTTYMLKMGGLLALYLLGIGASALFIVGIIKKRESFMVPWVMLSSFSVLSVSIYATYDVTTNGFDNMIYIFYDVAGICVACIVAYPVCMLYLEVRNVNRQRRQQIEQLNLMPQICTESNMN